MSTSHVLLGLLATGDQHGYDLKRSHDDRFPSSRPLAFGQVYATLDRMKKKGLIVTSEVLQDEGPERTVYSLTVSGRAELDQWLAEVETPMAFVSNPLATKATIALMVTDQRTATEFLRRQRESHLARMREYTLAKTQPTAALTEVLAADYAIAHLDADLRWIETAIERIEVIEREVGK